MRSARRVDARARGYIYIYIYSYIGLGLAKLRVDGRGEGGEEKKEERREPAGEARKNAKVSFPPAMRRNAPRTLTKL